MLFIHTADIHLGSRMDSRFPREIAERRRREMRETFERLCRYAQEKGAAAILLCGDVFDSDAPFKKDKEFFYGVISDHPQLDFLYLRGNHDTGEGFVGEAPQNLKLFGEEWSAFAFGDVVISGIEISPKNAVSMYSTLALDQDKTNVVMLHGQVSDNCGEDLICLKRLRDKNIDYLALGHVHKPSQKAQRLDSRGEWAYSGCLEGRGFDESGKRGFMELEIENGKVKSTFVPFASRIIEELELDISAAESSYGAEVLAQRALTLNPDGIYRLNLTGEVSFSGGELASDVASRLSGSCLYISVKDRTSQKLDLAQYENDATLKGEFVRTVMGDDSLNEDQKKRVIMAGLRALRGEEVEL